VGITGFLSVVAYDRATGARLWRTDRKPSDGASAAGLWMSKAPDGSLIVAGQAARGFLDWYTVAFETTGAVRWEAVRDGGLNTDEIPAAVLVLPDGTSVVTGRGGPTLAGGFWQGVTAGYSPCGTLLWEAFSPLVTVWVTTLPSGDMVATGGYDAYLAAFRPPGEIGTPYCQANPNSTGSPGRIAAYGSLVVTDNDFTLLASDLPPSTFGIFFFGPTQAQSPLGDSFLCVGGPISRLQPAIQVGAGGEATRAVDLTASPAAGWMVPGATVNFQFWYRDPWAMMSGFSLTNGVSLAFQ
jgi:hypothetical protein